MSYLTLKWGTMKAWDYTDSEEGKALLDEYYKEGSSYSAMSQKDTERQKEIICKLIDICDDPNGIYLDWDDKYVNKEEAKEYINKNRDTK